MGKFLLWAFRALLGVVLFCASVGPDDVDSNVSAWVERLGLSGLARALADQRVDSTAIIVAGLLLALTIILPWWSKHYPARPVHVFEPELRESVSASDTVEAEVIPAAERGLNRFFPPAVTQGKPTAKGDRNTAIASALGYAIHAHWERPVGYGIQLGGPRNYLDGPIERFREAALAGDLRVWGKREQNGLFVKIPQDFWDDNTLDEAALKSLFGQGRTIPFEDAKTDGRYYDIMVNRAEVEEVWPHEG